ncbi:aminopeptidase P family protein [Cognatishimia sp. WU-CL00825]|uniref:aminopeptidase P family protein n=1 Tax=Cognatishimia sp. WU-CL00825 TaxID=3127658 RepID=UPI003106C0DA
MFQTFDATNSPEQGPKRLTMLRKQMAKSNIDGFLVPRSDVHQGEYVAERDDRLAWLTGFTGSAGFCCVLPHVAGVFVDGRYRVQVKQQVSNVFSPVHWPETQLADWLSKNLTKGRVAFDPWLHTVQQVEDLSAGLLDTDLTLLPSKNLIDLVWHDQPDAPLEKAIAYPLKFAGETHHNKRHRLAAELKNAGQSATVITSPDSLCWLLNIRGNDIPRNPLVHGFAILHCDGHVDLFMEKTKVTELADHFGSEVTQIDPDTFIDHLAKLSGSIRLDKSSAPMAVASILAANDIEISYDIDPCALPKACKNQAELSATTEAHLRDGAAVCDFLAWFDENARTGITEIDLVKTLENYRRDTNLLRDLSFETIAGTGPNGAVIHYRVTHQTNRQLADGDIVVLDSGGQYLDGTTDITRTLPVGQVGNAERHAFTLVLQGMIAVSRLCWPVGLAGRDIEAFGRAPLWQAGLDFDHGLGHGVGTYLCVHEGPQRLSKTSHIALSEGMILSNEPGYYREGAFGIRIENLVVVEACPQKEGGDTHRPMLRFRTLTYAPIDRRLIVTEMLNPIERDWLNTYHQECFERLSPRVNAKTRGWLSQATAAV